MRIQDFKVARQLEPESKLFEEPQPGQLAGEIFVGDTVPSGHPVFLPLKSFGRGHALFAGASGSGKSTLLNLICLQVANHAPVMIYDTLDQAGKVCSPTSRPSNSA